MARSTGSSSERLGSVAAPPAARVYVDYAGFSPVDPRVVALMRPSSSWARNSGRAALPRLEAGPRSTVPPSKVARSSVASQRVIFTASDT